MVLFYFGVHQWRYRKSFVKGVHYVDHIKKNFILSFWKPAVTPHSLLFVALRFIHILYDRSILRYISQFSSHIRSVKFYMAGKLDIKVDYYWKYQLLSITWTKNTKVTKNTLVRSGVDPDQKYFFNDIFKFLSMRNAWLPGATRRNHRHLENRFPLLSRFQYDRFLDLNWFHSNKTSVIFNSQIDHFLVPWIPHHCILYYHYKWSIVTRTKCLCVHLFHKIMYKKI